MASFSTRRCAVVRPKRSDWNQTLSAMRSLQGLPISGESDIGSSTALWSSVALEERFDVVLFLNVLHHVPDPIFTVKRLTELCRDTLIVEFCLVDDPRYLQHLYGDPETPTLLARARAVLRSLILRCIGAGLPLMAVGNREYHRTFYCSPAAFRNLFMVHHKFFDAIQFIRSGQRTSHRAIAVCRVARRQTRTMGYEAETI